MMNFDLSGSLASALTADPICRTDSKQLKSHTAMGQKDASCNWLNEGQSQHW